MLSSHIIYIRAFPSIRPARDLNGTLDLNNHLNGARKLWKDQIFGPECLIVLEDKIYTGIHSGEVIRLNNEESVQPITKIGQPCGNKGVGATCIHNALDIHRRLYI
ncbi:hypothetical protein A7M48_23100 [Acinetobacter baumannii]|nr:hypothetical protein A7M48_23100 [Acinetobacter baumannii]